MVLLFERPAVVLSHFMNKIINITKLPIEHILI